MENPTALRPHVQLDESPLLPTSAPARQKKKLVECAFIFSGVRDWHGQDPNQVLTALSPCGPYRWQHSGTPSDYASESSVSWWSLVYNMYIRYNEENISVAVCECDRHSICGARLDSHNPHTLVPQNQDPATIFLLQACSLRLHEVRSIYCTNQEH